MSESELELYKAERDTIAGLCLLAATSLRYDPALKSTEGISHAHGFNVHCLVIDNTDGEVLSLEKNRIHVDENPLQHAEQLGLRAALGPLHKKRPRPVGMRVETYYKNALFMAPGTAPDDLINSGCTLYNTFDPCGMCAVTLLVAYMKRIAYLFEDAKFSGVYEGMRSYFKGRESVKEPLQLIGEDAQNPLAQAGTLIYALREKVKKLEHEEHVPLVETLDYCHEELRQALALLIQTGSDALRTSGVALERNTRTLAGVKRVLNIN